MKKISILFLSIFLNLVLLAQDGTLDNTFSGDGIEVTIGSNAREVLTCSELQVDQKIVSAGYYSNGSISGIILRRYNTDGSLDPTFDSDGEVLYSLTSSIKIYAIAIQNDGKIIVAGDYLTDFALFRFNADGTLDNSFGINGMVQTDLGGSERVYTLNVQNDGKIIAMGYMEASSDNLPDYFEYTIVCRYNEDGTLDSSFSGDGKYIFNSISAGAHGKKLVIQTDGKMVVSGVYAMSDNRTGTWITHYFIFVFRLNSDGTLDNSFSSNGYLTFEYDTFSWPDHHTVADVLVTNENEIVVLASRIPYANNWGDLGTSTYKFLIKFDSNGEIMSDENTFNGQAIYDLGGGMASAIKKQRDGKYLISSYSRSTTKNYYLTRIRPDFKIDNSFSANFSIGTYDDAIAHELLINGDKALICGNIETNSSANTYFAFAQINVSCAVPTISFYHDYSSACLNIENTIKVEPTSWGGNGGSATNYIWTLPNGWTGSSTNDSILVVPNANAGTISVIGSNVCGSSTPATLSLGIISETPLMSALTILGNSTSCEYTSQSYTYNSWPSSGAEKHTWTLPSSWTNVDDWGWQISATTDNQSGVISLTGSNACGSTTTYLNVTVFNGPPTISDPITGNSEICAGVANNYVIATQNDISDYVWTLPTGWSGNSTTNSIAVTPNSSNGQISVYGSNACGTSNETSFSITVVPSVPAQPEPITGELFPCENGTEIYSIPLISSADSYTWTLPNGWTGTSTTNQIQVNIGSGQGSILVKGINVCGSGLLRNIAVNTVSTVPASPVEIIGEDVVCVGSVKTYSCAAVASTGSYLWTKPSGWAGNSDQNTIQLTVGSSNGNITVKAQNGCGSSAATILPVTILSSSPNMPSSIIGSSTVCNGSTNTYSTSIVSTADSYTWTLSNGWVGNSTTESIDVVVNSSDAVISVKANNVCGSSAAKTLNVTSIDVPPTPSSISGDLSICRDSAVTYSISPVTDATSYTWTLPSGWNGSSTINSIATTAGNSGSISVTADNMCGASTPKSISINVVENPAHPVITKSGNILFCDITAFDYQWYVNGFPIPGATNQTYQINGDGNYSVVAFNSLGCFAESYFGYQVGIEENRLSSVNIIPNPSEGQFSINFGQYLNNVKLQVVDPSGKIVSEYIKLYSDKLQLNENLAKGFYFIQLTSDEGIYNQRIIIN